MTALQPAFADKIPPVAKPLEMRLADALGHALDMLEAHYDEAELDPLLVVLGEAERKFAREHLASIDRDRPAGERGVTV